MASRRAVQAVSPPSVAPLKQLLSVQATHATALTSSGQSPSIRCLSSLAAHHRQQFQQLASLMERATNNNRRTFVACSVVGHQYILENRQTGEAGVKFCATGVNHSLHCQFNGGKSLKGILRGCAEQNALGVAAASGHRYSAITDVYLYASCSSPCPHGRTLEVCDHASKGLEPMNDTAIVSVLTGVKGAVFPCPECWRNLSEVAAMRCDDGEAGLLNLFVHTHTEAGALRSLTVAQECLTGRKPPAIEVTIVLSG